MTKKSILKEVLEEIKPSENDKKEVESRVKAFVSKLNKGLKDAKAVLYGSGAKGTWLRGGFDADVFVKYDYKKYKDKSDQISDVLEKVLRKKFGKVERMHGSRDYFRIKEKDFVFEIIPILEIKKASEAKNITDISPLHAQWVKKKVNKKLMDEIRLVKAFFKAQKIYGAESYIRGYSGYITEILTIHYGGFEKLLRAARKWKDKEVVDICKYHKNVMMELNTSKLISPLIVVDPVDKSRNAAASLSYEKFDKLKEVADRFLKKSSKKFFVEKEVSVEDLMKKAGKNKLLLVDAAPLNGKEDVVGAKLMKSYEFLLKGLKKYGFNVKDKGWKWDKEKRSMFWYIVDSKKLDKFEKRKGPSLDFEEHVKKFKKKYKKTFNEKGRVCAKVKREFVDSYDFLKNLLKDKWLKDKVKGFKLRK